MLDRSAGQIVDSNLITAAQRRLDDLGAQEAVAELRLAEARGQLADARDQLSRRAIAASRGYSGNPAKVNASASRAFG